MRLEMHGDIISTQGGRIIVAIAIAEKADKAKMAIARRQTRDRIAASKPIDVTEARAKGLVL